MKSPLRILFAAALLFVLSNPAAAKNSKTKKQPPKQERVTIYLAPAPEMLDLALAKGALKSQSKKGKFDLKGKLNIPLVSSSLGIIDANTAQAAVLTLRLSAEGEESPYNTCILRFSGMSEDGLSWQYSLHVKNHGKRNVQGSCSLIQAPLSTDTAEVSALAGGVDVPFMTSVK